MADRRVLRLSDPRTNQRAQKWSMVAPIAGYMDDAAGLRNKDIHTVDDLYHQAIRMTYEQIEALLLCETEEERKRLIKKIKEHGDDYDPKTDWWPNKYPDM